MDYSKAIDWLYATQRFGIRQGLAVTRELVVALDALPMEGQTIFLITGTNGKGSTSALIDSLCRAHGLSSGLFTSPHLIFYCERIAVNGKLIPEEIVACWLTEIRNLVSSWERHPTFFEITTALGLRYFKQQRVDSIVLEVGMGGRLDTTNIVDATVAVLTPISIDHTKWLGDTPEKIAFEKAGIIKPKTKGVVSAPQLPGVLAVLQAKANECGAPFHLVEHSVEEFEVNLVGSHQKSNAAVAVAALESAGLELSRAEIARGLGQVQLSGRFQILEGGRFILDGAHNPAAMRRLVATWREVYGSEKAVVVCGFLRDKDYLSLCDALREVAVHFAPVTVKNPRSLPGEELAEVLQNQFPGKVSRCHELPVLLEQLKRERKEKILIAGSCFLVGEALAILQGRENDVRVSAQ